LAEPQVCRFMDTITHGIVGALTGKSLFAGQDVPPGAALGGARRALSSPTARVAIVGCTLGSIFPDIDIFAGPLAHNPLAIMEWHRNITHSAIMLPAWALVLAAVSFPLARWVKCQAPPFLNLFIIYAVGLATHIFLDLITSFGTMVWSPLRYSRPAWDWVFILDLTLTSIALVPQLASWCYREPGQFWRRAFGAWALVSAGAVGVYFFALTAGYGYSPAVVGVVSAIFASVIFLPAIRDAGFRWTRAAWCRAGLVVLCAYIVVAATAHHKALADVERFAAERNLQVENLAALPLPPAMTHWVGLIHTSEGVWRATFHEPRGAIETAHLYAEAPSLPLAQEAKKLRDVQTYLWFARFPVWRRVPDGASDTVIEIYDVRFFRERDPFVSSDPPGPGGVAGTRAGRAGFTFVVVFDALGRAISHGFKEPE
jgi:membrane-bound metal-dependent hydrolase YbcI (DUF457 family)